ncbi:MAG: Bifunctional purine biosynthesis protein PurH [Alphaproteobacteria bacterium MarineAlpha5_Bin9]|nr:MAG: Bifunctional purine biosynthesis protein PurH [Alphaproteobacteria bacterium MarineAlpha5_Bin9]|tara:strand:- start:14562 stop:16058 length:1497 start_codon:yes stop_codon:yes gene_type:complete
MIYKKHALISVNNKTNLDKICQTLSKHGINIIATNTTASYINSIGYKSISVSQITKFKEILDGKVKTLHPLIYASILFDRQNKKQLKKVIDLKVPIIDFVIVNFYNIEKKNLKNNKMDLVDIGGPTLLRSAAKNYKYITAVSDVNQYNAFIQNINNNNGKTSIDYRKNQASKVFEKTSNYDLKILSKINKTKKDPFFLDYDKTKLRYGENPHQVSFLYKKKKKNIFDNLLKNREISYNNILDIESGLQCIREFNGPTCIIIKHNNPCCASSDINIHQSFKNAIKTDPVSAFGGVVLFNRTLNLKLALSLKRYFFTIIVAKKLTKKAKLFLKNKKLILLESNNFLDNKNEKEIRSINEGLLVQEKNLVDISKKNIKCLTTKKLSNNEIKDLIFGLKICKYTKSNSIVLVKNKTTIGIGSGQTSRIDATKLALSKIKNITNFVAASDAFFPFHDNVKVLANKKCKGIVQPGGSKNDNKIIKYANKRKIAIYFSKYRFFRH